MLIDFTFAVITLQRIIREDQDYHSDEETVQLKAGMIVKARREVFRNVVSLITPRKTEKYMCINI